MLPEDRERLHEIVRSVSEVRDILRLITMHLGPDSVLMNAEVHLKEGFETDQIEDLLERITQEIRREMPEVRHTFIDLHSPRKAE